MTDTEQKQFNDYGNFVISTTSQESLHTETLVDKLMEIHVKHEVEFSQLLTASIGMQAEAGEFSEIIKKIIFAKSCCKLIASIIRVGFVF